MAEADRDNGGEREAMQLVERARERVDGDGGRRGRSKVVEGEREAEEEEEEEGGREAGAQASFRSGGDGNAITRFWTRQVALRVRREECRDHFALERTYLSYFRISLGLAILGVVIAQLFRLQDQVTTLPSPSDPASPTHPAFGFFRLAIPLSAICHGTAMLVALIGGFRFWRQQNALARGKVRVGGWELQTVGLIAFIAEVSIFVLVVALQAKEE